jgi:adenosylcobinamide-phosphate guanylyltransferase
MVDAVCDALADSRAERVAAAVSLHTPDTRAHLRERADCTVVETPGEGYVADLDVALDAAGFARPVLTCAADLPLLTADVVDAVLAAHADREATSLTVAVPAALKRELGVSCDTTFEREGRELAPTGLNVLGDDEGGVLVRADDRLAVNVNHRADAAVAASIAEQGKR